MAAPLIPQNVYVQQANGQVLVSWSPSPGAVGYVVQRSLDAVTYATVATPVAPQFLDTSVTTGLQYYYQVAATNGLLTSSYCPAQAVVPVLSGQMTLGQLRLLSQQKADRVNSQFVTLPEWNVYINQSYFELYDLLVQKFGNEYYVAPFLSLTTDGSANLALPDGVLYNGAPSMFKLLRVDLALNSAQNAYITLPKYQLLNGNQYAFPQMPTSLLGYATCNYRIIGNNLNFIPTPQAGQQIRLLYIPRMTSLLQDTDLVDGVSGWTEYIAVDAAIKALQKEESDVSVLMAQKQALIDRIESAAENRDAGQPEKITDVSKSFGGYDYGFGGGNGGWF